MSMFCLRPKALKARPLWQNGTPQFMPDLEGVDTVDRQISIAMQKAGIKPQEKVQLQRFEVIRHV